VERLGTKITEPDRKSAKIGSATMPRNDAKVLKSKKKSKVRRVRDRNLERCSTPKKKAPPRPPGTTDSVNTGYKGHM